MLSFSAQHQQQQLLQQHAYRNATTPHTLQSNQAPLKASEGFPYKPHLEGTSCSGSAPMSTCTPTATGSSKPGCSTYSTTTATATTSTGCGGGGGKGSRARQGPEQARVSPLCHRMRCDDDDDDDECASAACTASRTSADKQKQKQRQRQRQCGDGSSNSGNSGNCCFPVGDAKNAIRDSNVRKVNSSVHAKNNVCTTSNTTAGACGGGGGGDVSKSRKRRHDDVVENKAKQPCAETFLGYTDLDVYNMTKE